MSDGDISYRLGRIDGRLEAIERRLEDGSKRHQSLDGRLDAIEQRSTRLELAEAKRGGVIAAISATAGIVGSVFVSYLNRKL